MAVTSKQMMEAAKKAGAWLASQQTERGNYIGNEKPDKGGNYSDTDDLGCYYKSIYPLRVVGETIAAAKGMNFVVSRFMSPEGDLFNTETNRTSGSYTPNFCQLYPNMWLMRAAVAMCWYRLYQKILGFLLKYRDPETGGFYATVMPPTKVIDSNATGLGALCCLLGGRVKLAVESADFVLKMLEAQPPGDKFYTRWEKDKGYQTDISGVEEKARKYYYIDAKEPAQAYWCWAWPMNSLIGLYEYTNEKRFLTGAIKIYDFLASSHPNAFGYATAGKGGWGSSMLYRITGDKRYLKTALSQMEWIINHQHKDGYMMGENVHSIEEQPLRTTYDFTADFSTWLVDTPIEIVGRE